MKLLVDGDPLAYRASLAKDTLTEKDAIDKTEEIMEELLYEVCPTGSYEVYLTGKGNFRDSIATNWTYKGNRTGEKPYFLPHCRELLVNKYSATIVHGIEADDIIATRATELDFKCVVASVDKDFLQLPCYHYNYVTQSMVSVSEAEAQLNFYTQCLTGDRVDNIQGVQGIGPAKAAKLLDISMTPKEMWDIVVEQHDTPERALEDARLLWLQRHKDELWEPPNEDSVS